jgi:hypothetical protein
MLVEIKERHRLKDLGLDGRIILKWVMKKFGVKKWAQDRIILSVCVNTAMTFGLHKHGEFLNQLNNYQRFNEVLATSGS